MFDRGLYKIIFTTRNELINPVPKAHRALDPRDKSKVGIPWDWAKVFLKFSNKPNLTDPRIPTPISGVTVPLYKARGPSFFTILVRQSTMPL